MSKRVDTRSFKTFAQAQGMHLSSLANDLELIEEGEFASFRGITIRALRNERSLGKGIAYIKLGKKVFYSKASILAFVAENTILPESAPTLKDGSRIRRKARGAR